MDNNISNVLKNKVAYIIPYKENDIYKKNNLLFIIKYTIVNYKFINIYIIEQDDEKKLFKNEIINKFIKKKLINYNFLYKKSESIDRGNIFNCAIKHFIKDEKILIMGDTDIPLMNNIYKLFDYIINDKYYFISPYTYLSKINKQNTKNIIIIKNLYIIILVIYIHYLVEY